MFCEGCGAPLEPGQQYCQRCGRALAGVVSGRISRVNQHVRLLGVLWIAYSVLHALAAGFLLVIANTMFAVPDVFGSHGPPHFLQGLLTLIGIAILAKSVAGIAAGVGLLQHQPWARMLTIVVAVISLVNVPFGTALGIYSLWVLWSPSSESDYQVMAQQSA